MRVGSMGSLVSAGACRGPLRRVLLRGINDHAGGGKCFELLRLFPCPRHARCCHCATDSASLHGLVLAFPFRPRRRRAKGGTSMGGRMGRLMGTGPGYCDEICLWYLQKTPSGLRPYGVCTLPQVCHLCPFNACNPCVCTRHSDEASSGTFNGGGQHNSTVMKWGTQSRDHWLPLLDVLLQSVWDTC